MVVLSRCCGGGVVLWCVCAVILYTGVCGGGVVLWWWGGAVGYSVCNNNYEFCIFSLDRGCSILYNIVR